MNIFKFNYNFTVEGLIHDNISYVGDSILLTGAATKKTSFTLIHLFRVRWMIYPSHTKCWDLEQDSALWHCQQE